MNHPRIITYLLLSRLRHRHSKMLVFWRDILKYYIFYKKYLVSTFFKNIFFDILQFRLVWRPICLERVRTGIGIGCLFFIALVNTIAWWSFSKAIWHETCIRFGKFINSFVRISYSLRDASIRLNNSSNVARINRGRLCSCKN